MDVMLAQRPRFRSTCHGSAEAKRSSISSSSSTSNRVLRASTSSGSSDSGAEEQGASTSRPSSSFLQIGRRDALAAAASLSLAFVRPSLVAAAEATETEASRSAAKAPPSPSSSSSSSSSSPSSSSSERFEAADFSLTVPAGFGLAEVAKAGYTPTTAEERGARGRGIAAPDSPVKVRFTAPAAEGGGVAGGVGSSELSVIVRDAAGIKPTFLMVSDISQWGDAAAVGAVLLPRGVTVTRASTESVELPARDTGSIAGVVASPPQTSYLYEFEDQRGDLFVTLAAVARAGKIYVVAGSARGRAAWEARREGMREAVRSFRVTPTLR